MEELLKPELMTEREAESLCRRLCRRLCAFLGFEVRADEDAAAAGARPIIASSPDRRQKDGGEGAGSYNWPYWSWDAMLFGYQDPGQEYDDEQLFVSTMAMMVDVEGPERSYLYGFDYMRFAEVRSQSVGELSLKLAAAGY